MCLKASMLLELLSWDFSEDLLNGLEVMERKTVEYNQERHLQDRISNLNRRWPCLVTLVFGQVSALSFCLELALLFSPAVGCALSVLVIILQIVDVLLVGGLCVLVAFLLSFRHLLFGCGSVSVSSSE